MIFLVLLGLILHSFNFDLINFFAFLSQPLHQLCLEYLPETSAKTISAAILCGDRLPLNNFSDSLKRLSLLHLFVVSGSHLIFLNSFLHFCRIPTILQFLILLFYCAICRFDPPVTRSFVQLILIHFLSGFNLKPETYVFLAGVLCCLLSPPWMESLSLALSWATSLALVSVDYGQPQLFWKKHLFSQIRINVALSAFFLQLNFWHPICFAVNIFLGPLIAGSLLLLTVFSLTQWSPMVYILEISWQFWQFILIHLSQLAPTLSPLNAHFFQQNIMWLWIFGLHTIFFLWRLSTRVC